MCPTVDKHIFWLARALEQALTNGVETWASDTTNRSNWLHTDHYAWHVIAGTMLVGCFAYTEGKMGRKWWLNMNSRSAKRDLDILWIVRNAFVHKDSIPNNLRSTTSDDISKIDAYCRELEEGKILDDKGNAYPVFMMYQGNRIILKRESINVFARLFETAYRSFCQT